MADVKKLTKWDAIRLLEKANFYDSDIEDAEDSIDRNGLVLGKEYGQETILLGYSGIKIMDKEAFSFVIEDAAYEYIQDRIDTSDDFIGEFIDIQGFVNACYKEADYTRRVLDIKDFDIVDDYVIITE